MDLSASTATLAAAAADIVRLVPARYTDPLLSGLLLTAGRDGVVLAASDRERTARVSCDALVHTDGTVLVPAKPLAETLRALDVDRVRLVVEGSRLAIRADGARFALPLLDAALHPGVPTPPPPGGTVSGAKLSTALSTVSATASRDDTLPVFAGVRLRAEDGALVLRATDRYRMAIATVPATDLSPDIDVLVPAGLLSEVAKQASGEVSLATDPNRFTLSWGNTTVTTAVLDGVFLSESSLVLNTVDTWVETDADALLAAARRVALYTDARGVLQIEVGDHELRLRGTDPQAGEAEESVKATVEGGRTSPAVQSRYLIDALRPYTGTRIRLSIQPGMRATVITSVDEQEVPIKYLMMPLLPPRQ
ncbi:DNA polymerase III subunit beta [Actinokineospora sp. UTMC 2448]|uniref:DNA polymerase III subunit beta n=1 Tax=Actinokineospora sp. UTMC 2448 TaxID=2268449 RepID=UPI0021644A62|nr:DNA polymerase III subunit beta [Actinokineospora sp. UTMC 2448]UVS76578.1 DNA polymerase III subunit beta [Actinokineospora sp. UTMC 2448]